MKTITKSRKHNYRGSIFSSRDSQNEIYFEAFIYILFFESTKMKYILWKIYFGLAVVGHLLELATFTTIEHLESGHLVVFTLSSLALVGVYGFVYSKKMVSYGFWWVVFGAVFIANATSFNGLSWPEAIGLSRIPGLMALYVYCLPKNRIWNQR